jgi:hypothetical protein
MQQILDTIPREAVEHSRTYREAIDTIDHLGSPTTRNEIAIRRQISDAEAAITKLNGILYRWLSAKSDETISSLAAAAPDVVEPALRLRVGEPHNLAYLVVREYCADGRAVGWDSWRQLRRMEQARA